MKLVGMKLTSEMRYTERLRTSQNHSIAFMVLGFVIGLVIPTYQCLVLENTNL